MSSRAGRWRYSAKREVWDCINQRSKSHSLIVAEINRSALTRELVADIDSLLIHRVKPLCNVQNVALAASAMKWRLSAAEHGPSRGRPFAMSGFTLTTGFTVWELYFYLIRNNIKPPQ